MYLPNCDRLTYSTAKTLADHAIKDMGRIYRKSIENLTEGLIGKAKMPKAQGQKSHRTDSCFDSGAGRIVRIKKRKAPFEMRACG